MSATFLVLFQSLVSAANLDILLTIFVSRSFNCSGPKLKVVKIVVGLIHNLVVHQM